MIKLHLGCGPRNFGPDWIHIDGGDYSHLDYKNIVSLPYEDNSVDLIYASHVLEYFSREEASNVLKSWYDSLGTHAALYLAVPDFQAMAKLYCEQHLGLENFLGPLYGEMPYNHSRIYHKTVYDFSSLVELLEEAGYNNIERYDWRDFLEDSQDDCSRAYIPKMDFDNGTLISLNIKCQK